MVKTDSPVLQPCSLPKSRTSTIQFKLELIFECNAHLKIQSTTNGLQPCYLQYSTWKNACLGHNVGNNWTDLLCREFWPSNQISSNQTVSCLNYYRNLTSSSRRFCTSRWLCNDPDSLVLTFSPQVDCRNDKEHILILLHLIWYDVYCI